MKDTAAERAGMRMCGKIGQLYHIEAGVRRPSEPASAIDKSDYAACAQELAARRAFTADDDDFFSALFTGPDFCCVLFEIDPSKKP